MGLIIIFLPLITALLAGFFGWFIGQKGSMFITTFGMFLSAVFSWVIFFKVGLGSLPQYLVLGK